jgi:hypothetical protein
MASPAAIWGRVRRTGIGMKTSLDHLPEKKRTKLVAMAAKIRFQAPQAEMIILFGSHAIQQGGRSALRPS